jgi:hypothetical protein
MRTVQLCTSVVVSALVAISLLAGAANAITNGQPDGGRHRYVGLVVFDDAPGHPAWRCTGTLLSPTVLLTAGHGTYGAVAARVWFDEVVQGNPEYPYSGVTSYDGIPHTNPDFVLASGQGIPNFDYRDVGIVVLTEPVPTSVVSEYGQLPTAGLVDTLPVMTDVDLVGYGVQYKLRPEQVWQGTRVRLYAPAKLLSGNFAWSDEFIRCTANPGQNKGGTALGDSGGPVFLANTKTILAVNSYVTNSNCAGATYHSRIDIPEVLDWIRSFMGP